MLNTLYFEKAYLYQHIANDRDFAKECQFIQEIYENLNQRTPSSLLELFAGPAFHAGSFFKNQIETCYAIDYSETMREIAIDTFAFPNESYIIGELPQAIFHLPSKAQLDIILIMRYSLGLIDYDNAEKLLQQLSTILTNGGIVVIELHYIPLLVGELTTLEIKKRTRYIKESNESVSCIWPSGPIKWDNYSWSIRMPIQLEVQCHLDNSVKTFDTESHEFVFVAADIQRMTRKHGLEIIPLPEGFEHIFPQSNLIILQKKEFK
jgi:SAM-dependent methyltransferase